MAGRRAACGAGAAALVAVALAVPVADSAASAGAPAERVESVLALPVADSAARGVVPAPTVEQLVVFGDGTAVAKRVGARQVGVRVGRRRCAVGAGTPLAALVRSHVGALRLRDYGSCSTRPRDAAGLFVRGIRADRNRGQDGWVYKLGARVGSAGAADPSGPFGAGRLRPGARVTWFYCRTGPGGCQRTLALRTAPAPGGLSVRVRGHDDRGHWVPVAGATVHAGSATATTGADGSALVALASGRVIVYAEAPGMVRSFGERVTVP
jgi:hypothetical protein